MSTSEDEVREALLQDRELARAIEEAQRAVDDNDSISDQEGLEENLEHAEAEYEDNLHGNLLVVLHNHYDTWGE